MSELTTSTAKGRIIRFDADFIMLDGGIAFWLEPTIRGEGIKLGDMVKIEYNITTMQVTSISKAGEQ